MATPEEMKLIEALRTLKITPKADSPEDLQKWLKEYSAGAGAKSVTEVVKVSTHQPRLSIFYGDTDSLTKGEATYDQWRYEVKSLMFEKTHKEEIILQAIRRSVRGEAGRILMRLGTGATLLEILDKFESVYGVVDTKESLLAKFYSAKQEKGEDTTAWSCRLEDILTRAVEKGQVKHEDANEILRSMFWTGLRQDLKDVSGYKFDAIKDFDKLRMEIRKIEQEHNKNDSPKDAKVATAKSAVEAKDSEMKELREMVKEVTTTVKNMGQQLTELSGTVHRQQMPQAANSGHNDHSESERYQPQGRGRPTNYNRGRDQRGYRQQSQPRNDTGYNQHERRQNGPTHSYQDRPRYTETQRSYGNLDGIQCFRCGLFGHFQWDCRTRLDHSKRLN